MIATQEEQARVYNAVEAVLKAQTGAYKSRQQSQDSQAHGSAPKEHRPTRDAA